MRSCILISLILGLCSVGFAAATDDCTALSTLLPGQVFFAGGPPYNESVSSYFYLQERLRPACVIAPNTTEQVASIITVLQKSGSRFAIRGGGHGSTTGSANVQDGITIDMRSIDAVSVSGDGRTASVGAGASWEQVYSVLDQRNLSVLGGRAAHVGVGGLIIGGGISFFSPRYGFVCDNVANFQVVLANGSITNANMSSNTDLFVALKGGTNNFGVVTRYDLKTFSQGLYWGGGITYPDSTTDQQIAAFNTIKSPGRFDPYVEPELSFVYLGALRTFLGATSLFYTRPVVNASALRPFTSIQPQLSNSMRISNTTDFAREILSLSTPDQYSVWATTTFAITPTILSRIHPIWRSSALSMNNLTNVTSSMTLQSVPPPAPASLPNSLGFVPDSTPQDNLVLCLISIFFEDVTFQEELEDMTKDFIDAVEDIADDEGVNVDFTYLNYAGSWQDPLKDYGEAQYQTLRSVATKYDPMRVFQNQVGGFKLFRRDDYRR